jgi:hypothetical protein
MFRKRACLQRSPDCSLRFWIDINVLEIWHEKCCFPVSRSASEAETGTCLEHAAGCRNRSIAQGSIFRHEFRQ